jgi:deoxyguanosine kinase
MTQARRAEGQVQFIAVEGLIGAGKTTLCRLLERRWNAELILEPSENNPFLEPFYQEPARFAFPVQMFYLVNRWRQQGRIRQPDLFASVVVSDYLFAKDRLFAEKTLPELELELYDRFASALGESAPVPDLVVWLEAPTEVLLQRIARRRAPGEAAITAEYIDDLRERYERLWRRWSASPLLRIDNRDMNYADDVSDQNRVLGLIQGALAGIGAGGSSGALGSPGSVDREDQPNLFGPRGS